MAGVVEGRATMERRASVGPGLVDVPANTSRRMSHGRQKSALSCFRQPRHSKAGHRRLGQLYITCLRPLPTFPLRLRSAPSIAILPQCRSNPATEEEGGYQAPPCVPRRMLSTVRIAHLDARPWYLRWSCCAEISRGSGDHPTLYMRPRILPTCRIRAFILVGQSSRAGYPSERTEGIKQSQAQRGSLVHAGTGAFRG